MANKPINALENAAELTTNDLIVLWQQSTNSAKNFTGQQLTAWLTSLAAGKGGIARIDGPISSGLADTYTIVYANGDTSTFTVHNGAQGDQGDQTYVWIKYAEVSPTSDSDISDIPGPWIGIYAGTESEAPTDYTQYEWYEFKGPPGDGVVRTVGVADGLTTHYTMYTADGVECGRFDVTNGSGGASTVAGIAPVGDAGNVPLIVNSVSALGLTVGSATIADAYTALLVNQTLRCPATDFATTQLPSAGATYLTDGTVDIYKGANNDGWIDFHSHSDADYSMAISNDTPSETWERYAKSGDFSIAVKTGSATTIAAGSAKVAEISIVESGKRPIGVVGVRTQNADVLVGQFYFQSNLENANLILVNISNSQVTVTPDIRVMYEAI